MLSCGGLPASRNSLPQSSIVRFRWEFSEEQMVAILREADQRSIAEVAKKHGVSDQTIDAWRKRVGTLEPADVKRLRQVEQDNGRLKKMVADRDLEIDVLTGADESFNGKCRDE